MHLWVRKLELFQSDLNLSAPISSQLQLFQSCCTYFEPILIVTRIETIWFIMFRANFNNFNLTLPFLSGVSYFFEMLFPYFEQISQNNGPFWINFNSFQLYVCVCAFETSESVSRWLHLFRATHNYFAPKLHWFQFNCSYEASLGAVLLTSLNFLPLPTILHRREKPNKLHRKIFD